MIVACPVCKQKLEAEGYRDLECSACGAIVPRAANACPRCVVPLQSRQVADMTVEDCATCGGVFLDHRAIDRIIADHQHERAEALLASVRAAAPRPVTSTTDSAICPRCNGTMERRLSATGAGVVLDVCRPHGVYLDAGELHAIVAFVERDAREQARRRAEEQHYRWQRGVFDPPPSAQPSKHDEHEASTQPAGNNNVDEAVRGAYSFGILLIRILTGI